ncbi:hypothetical protein J437_LFUL015417 [Ladona fulva]|uniref:E3 ubiquitin-protein ligase UBR7 n=1 Tax=Ladona fulva TaxID=123851 RepID=A0A8K0KKN2_LADFU|nr:hypothetical protein J437_LFUL015417 [Ladona fulva]
MSEAKDASAETEDTKKEVADLELEAKMDSKEIAEVCKMKTWNAISSSGATYWTQNWRKSLCTCPKCKDLYEVEKVSFLLDKDDPVQVYEEEGKAKDSASQYEEGLRALSSLGHVQKVDAIQEYNMMQTHLKNYLKKFAESKKVVREEDIREFFSEMESRKKQRADVHVPHFCH